MLKVTEGEMLEWAKTLARVLNLNIWWEYAEHEDEVRAVLVQLLEHILDLQVPDGLGQFLQEIGLKQKFTYEEKQEILKREAKYSLGFDLDKGRKGLRLFREGLCIDFRTYLDYPAARKAAAKALRPLGGTVVAMDASGRNVAEFIYAEEKQPPNSVRTEWEHVWERKATKS